MAAAAARQGGDAIPGGVGGGTPQAAPPPCTRHRAQRRINLRTSRPILQPLSVVADRQITMSLNSNFRQLANPTHAIFKAGRGAHGARAKPSVRAPVNAPPWTWVGATAAHEAMLVVGAEYREQAASLMMLIVVSPGVWRDWTACVRRFTTAREAEAAIGIFRFHHDKAYEAGGTHMATPAGQHIRNAYRVLLRRVSKPERLEPLVLPPPPPMRKLAEVLAEAAQPHRIRPIKQDGRIVEGLQKWDWSGFTGRAVVCYERAADRLRNEFPGYFGKPPAWLVESLVARELLPTAMGSPGDHYVWVTKRDDGSMAFEFMPVGEGRDVNGRRA